MKQIVIVLMLALSFTLSAKKVEVPTVVNECLTQKFPKAKDVKWKKGKDDMYNARFKQNESTVKVLISASGEWQQTETSLSAEQIPSNIVKAMRTKYANGEFSVLNKMEMKGKPVKYEGKVSTPSADFEIVLNEQGKILSTKKIQQQQSGGNAGGGESSGDGGDGE